MASNTDIASVLPAGWISLAELSRRLGVHTSTLFRWRRQGVRGARLRTTRIGGRTGVEAPRLAEFFEQLNAPRAGTLNNGGGRA